MFLRWREGIAELVTELDRFNAHLKQHDLMNKRRQDQAVEALTMAIHEGLFDAATRHSDLIEQFETAQGRGGCRYVDAANCCYSISG